MEMSVDGFPPLPMSFGGGGSRALRRPEPASTAAGPTAKTSGVATGTATAATSTLGHFDFDDGGNYRGGSDGGRAHGYGVCTGPGGQGEYAGAWREGFETSGVYHWPSSVTNADYAGQWMQGKRHGLGVERRGRWVYRGEWTQGAMGRYGVRQCDATTTSEAGGDAATRADETTQGARPSSSGARYEGTWTAGLQDGYGLETYSDGGTYQGQWMKGARHGYGVRKSAVYLSAAACRPRSGPGSSSGHNLRSSSLTSTRSEQLPDLSQQQQNASASKTSGGLLNTPQQQLQQPHHHHHHHHHHGRVHTLGQASQPSSQSVAVRIGFFLTGRCVESDADSGSRRGSFLGRKSSSAGSGGDRKRHGSVDDIGAGGGSGQYHFPQSQTGIVDTIRTQPTAIETYSGEWKNDKRSGFGVCERSDGLRYEGEWLDDCKCGYGVTTFGGGPDVPGGWREEGKYRNNVLTTSGKRLFGVLPPLVRSSKQRERIDAAVASAIRAAQIAAQKSDIANSRMESARSKAELADQAAAKARADADRAKMMAKEIEQRERSGIDHRMPPHRHGDVPPPDGRRERTTRSAGQPGLDPQYKQQINVPNHIQPQGHRPPNVDEQYIQRTSVPFQNRLNQAPDRRLYVDGLADDGYDSAGGGPYEDGDRLVFRDNSLHGRRVRRPDGRFETETDRMAMKARPTGSRPSPAPSNSSLNQQQQQQLMRQYQYQQQQAPMPDLGGHPDYSMMNHVDPSNISGLRFRLPTSAPSLADSEQASIGGGPVPAGATDVTANGQLDQLQHPIDDSQQPTENGVPSKSLTSRPSLRLRRDFRCPNLVIFNKNGQKTSSTTNLRASTARGGVVNPGTGETDASRGGASAVSTSSAPKPATTIQLPKRRLTLPGIMKCPVTDGPRQPTAAIGSRLRSKSSDRSSPSSRSVSSVSSDGEGLSVRGGKPATEIYIVENCSRRRLEEFEISLPPPPPPPPQQPAAPAASQNSESGRFERGMTPSTLDLTLDQPPQHQLKNPLERSTLAVVSPDGLDPPKPITRRYRVAESVIEPGLSRRWASGRKDMLGSLPDISAVYRQQQPTPIPRQEAEIISLQKRDELQRLLEQEEERRRKALVLRLGDFKDWVHRRQFSITVIALNLAFAAAFYQLVNG